jgi:hypothetical protein
MRAINGKIARTCSMKERQELLNIEREERERSELLPHYLIFLKSDL